MDFASLRMIIEWPNGSRLPVRLASHATGADLIALLQFACPANSPFLLLKDGHYLHPQRQLCRQKIHDDSVIRVVNFATPRHSLIFSDETKSDDLQSESLDGIFSEILRLTDLQFNLLEAHKKGELICRSFLADPRDDEPEPEVHKTRVPAPPAAVSVDPLPLLRGSSESETDYGDSDEDGEDDGAMTAKSGRVLKPHRFEREWNW
jgi:hypothetical protein